MVHCYTITTVVHTIDKRTNRSVTNLLTTSSPTMRLSDAHSIKSNLIHNVQQTVDLKRFFLYCSCLFKNFRVGNLASLWPRLFLASLHLGELSSVHTFHTNQKRTKLKNHALLFLIFYHVFMLDLVR